MTNDIAEEETPVEAHAAGTTSTLPPAAPKPKTKPKKTTVHPNTGWEPYTPPPEPLVR